MNEEDYEDDEDVDPLAEIRQRFAMTLPDWRDEAASLRLMNDSDALRSHCHRIKGTAGMLGCMDLSAAGAECELILSGERPESTLDEALEALFRCIDSVVEDHAPS